MPTIDQGGNAAYSPRPLGGGTHVTCLACGGKGYVTTRDYRNVPMPMRCPGCHGTGSQRVGS